VDGINRRWGRGTLRWLAEGLTQPWQMRRERLSPGYTTDWHGLPVVR
jgi:DNA polymerase V